MLALRASVGLVAVLLATVLLVAVLRTVRLATMRLGTLLGTLLSPEESSLRDDPQ